jgi:hypothetical protein
LEDKFQEIVWHAASAISGKKLTRTLQQFLILCSPDEEEE